MVAMKYLTYILTLILVKALYAEEVKIRVDHLPEECTYKVRPGDRIKVHYTGKLQNGAIFDSSLRPGREPIEFILGARQVIVGWEQGINGMCVGEKRHLSIPPELGYGKAGHPPVIPPDSWLYFDTELMGYESGKSDTSKVIDVDWLMANLRYIMLPILGAYVMRRVYKRYQEDTQTPSKAAKKTKIR